MANLFEVYNEEALKQIENGLVHPAYDYVLKCSHTFNLMDARGMVSATDRAGFLARIRNMARKLAVAFVEKRKELGFPLLDEAERERLLKEEA